MDFISIVASDRAEDVSSASRNALSLASVMSILSISSWSINVDHVFFVLSQSLLISCNVSEAWSHLPDLISLRILSMPAVSFQNPSEVFAV